MESQSWDLQIGTVIAIVLMLALFFGPFLVYLRRQRARKELAVADSASAPIEGTDADRERAEQSLREWSTDLRKELAKTHEIVGRLNTIDGYSVDYVEDLLNEIRAAGISADYNFQPTSPMGVGASLITRQGDFEIFVEQTKVEEALPIIEKFRAR